MANNKRGDDAVAARKLARSEPMSGPGSRSDETPRRSHLDRLRPGQDPSRAIDKLYALGRSFPREQPAKVQGRPAANSDPMFSVSREDGIAGNFSGPQDPVDQPGPGYFNDTGNNWVRGANEDGRKPGFDNSPPRSKMRR